MRFKNKKLDTDLVLNQKTRDTHHQDFGFDVPKDYFSISRNQILNETINKSKSKSKVLVIALSGVAAMLVLVFMIKKETHATNSFVLMDGQDENFVFSSLFINDEKIECFSDAYMLGDLYQDDLCIN